MTTLAPLESPIDLPPGAEVRRPEPERPFVAMSNRKRWSRCALSAVLPQIRTASGPAAEEGTEAHAAAEWAMNVRFNDTSQSGRSAPVPPPGLEDFDYSEAGVAAWRVRVDEFAQTYAANAAKLVSDCTSRTSCLTEYKIDSATIHGVRVYTVADVILWNPDRARLIVGDYKFGRSPVGVGTADAPNEQCAGAAVLRERQRMALGAAQPAQQIGLFVYQPRTVFGDPWQVLAPLGPAWLQAEGVKLDAELAAVARAASEMAAGRLVDPQPGEHCKYCPSARWCPAAAAFGAAAADVDAGRRAVGDFAPEEVMALWAARDAFAEFAKDLAERVRMLHECGHPAVTVRRRRGQRIWANPTAAAEALMLIDRYDLLRPPPLTSLEGIMADADLAALTTRSPDVITYAATDGKQPDTARAAFAKFLKGGD